MRERELTATHDDKERLARRGGDGVGYLGNEERFGREEEEKLVEKFEQQTLQIVSYRTATTREGEGGAEIETENESLANSPSASIDSVLVSSTVARSVMYPNIPTAA